MDIFNNETRKIVCINNDDSDAWGFSGTGYLLTVGMEYTLVNTKVYGWHTRVELKEFPNVQFNSILFKEIYKFKNGIFLARMQPLHKAHMYIIETALKECEHVTIILGSSNKKDMLRNPFDLERRKSWVERALVNSKDYNRISIYEVPDWSYENDKDDVITWGRYFYYNVVSRIESKKFTIYYNDDLEIINSWFNSEVKGYITIRHLERSEMFNGLSATKIREAILKQDLDYLSTYLPEPVFADFNFLYGYYKQVTENPMKDFSME